MGRGEFEIQTIVLSDEVLGLGQESEAWGGLVNKIREACERHGCFLVECPKITEQLHEELFTSLKGLFDLPVETKSKYKKTSLESRGYVGAKPSLPLYESCDLGAPTEEEAQILATQMWPSGNQLFCEAVNSMNSRLQELYFIILRMMFQGLGIEKHFESLAGTIRFRPRASKYDAPPLEDGENDEPTLGLPAHVDRDILTFLCQNSAQGLELLSAGGDWVEMAIPKASFAVFIGDVFQVWSNGRYEPVRHRVMMKGRSTRYSYALFSYPEDGVSIEVPAELVDEEHPVRFRPFIYSDYRAAHAIDLSPNVLQNYAGISLV